jgi:hypothetical protein
VSLATLLAGRVARIALLAPALARMKRNAVRAALGIGLVALFGGLGLAYLLVALRVQLEREIGPLWAPLAIGGVLALAALVAYLALLRPRRRRAPAMTAESAGLPPELGASMRTLETKVAQNPLPSIAVALAAGFAAAALLRLLRQRSAAPRPRADGAADTAPPPRTSRSEPPPWTRETIVRETERRKGNGRAP